MNYLMFILGLNMMLAFGYHTLAADLRDDREEFDLYDRMRGNQEFSDYSYPNSQRYQPGYPDRYETYPDSYPDSQRYEPYYPQRNETYYPDRYERSYYPEQRGYQRGYQSSCPSCQQGRRMYYQRDVDDYNNRDSGY